MSTNREQVANPVKPMESPATSMHTMASLLEEGSAFTHLAGAKAAKGPERVEVVVVGAGQAGLSIGYHLARLGIRCVILDAHHRVGDAWRTRWDSLRLFTSARFDGLDGMRFPQPGDAFPTKDEMGDFLEDYARHFGLPVRTGTKVDRVSRRGDRYLVTADTTTFEADHVVVAMSSYQDPWTPPFAAGLDPAIVQLHSFAYRNPSQLRDGDALIVGAGNSGSEIAMELARDGRTVWMSGRDTGHIPFRIEGLLGRTVMARLVLRVLFHRVFTLDTPIGRKLRPQFISAGGPLIRVKPRDLAAAGVRRIPRVASTRNGLPLLDDGRLIDVPNVIWCTGFRNDFSWIDLPVYDDRGEPIHERGCVTGEPGLYFLGLHFLYAASSTMVQGVGRDASHIARRIAARTQVASQHR